MGRRLTAHPGGCIPGYSPTLCITAGDSTEEFCEGQIRVILVISTLLQMQKAASEMTCPASAIGAEPQLSQASVTVLPF